MSTPLLSFTKRQLRRFPGPWWREGYQRQVLFIASSVRSGSTWLSYVLGNHPRSAHLGEYHRPFEISGHVACRLCEAQGLPDCEILHGIEDVPINAAYGFALSLIHI